MVGLGALGIVFGRPLSQGVSEALSGAAPGLSGVVPAAGGFRIYSVTSPDPDISTGEFRLRVHGLVGEPATLTFADLAAMPQTQMTKDFQCVTGWRVDDVPWSGVLVRDVLGTVGADSGAAGVHFTSADGIYTESLTMEQAQRPDMLVATSMWGAPIARQHGGPVRLLAAPMYGYKSLKWLDGIEVTSAIIPGYWENRGYDIDAWVGRSNGRTDAPIA